MKEYTIKINIESCYNFGLKLLLFLPPFVIIKNICDFANLPQGLFIQLSVLLIASLFFFISAKEKKFHLKIKPLHLPLVLWISWASLSLFWATSVYDSVFILLKWYAGFITFLLISNYSKKSNIILLRILFWSGFVVALIGILQLFFNFQYIPQVRPPSSTFGHKNVAIHYIILTLPLGLSFVMISNDKLQNWCYQLAISSMIFYIFITFTRAGWVILFFQALLLLAIITCDHFKKNIRPLWYSGKSIPLLIGIIITLLLMQSSSINNAIPKAYTHLSYAAKSVMNHYLFKSIDDNEIKNQSNDDNEIKNQSNDDNAKTKNDNSFKGRIDVWLNSLAIVKDFPFLGVGLGNFRVFFEGYQNKIVVTEWVNEKYRVYNAHNDHVQIFVELGLIGGLLWCFLIWRTLKLAIFYLQNYTQVQDRYIIIGILMGIFGVLVNACFSFPFQVSLPPFVFLFYLGVLSSFHSNEEKQKIIFIPKKICIGLSVCCMLLFFGLLYHANKWIKADYHFLRMLTAERMQKWPVLINEANIAIELDPYRKEFYSFLGRGYIESKDPQKAIEPLKKMLETYPYHINCLLNIGVAYLDLGKNQIAEQFFKKVIKLLPDIILAHKLLANIYINRKQYDNNLMDELSWLLAKEPQNQNILFNLGMTYIYMGEISNAIDLYKKIIDLNPEHIGSYMQLIKIFLNQKNLQEAEKYFNELIKINIENPLILFETGNLALEMRKPQEAKYCFENAIKKDLKYLNFLFDFAKTNKEKKRYDKAMMAYQILIQIHPFNAAAHNNLGNIYKNKKMFKKALIEYIIAAKYQPKNHIFHFNIGYMAMQLEDYIKAENAFNKVIQLKSDWAIAHKNLGVLLFNHLKREKEGLLCFQKALTLNPMIDGHEILKDYLLKFSIIQTLQRNN